MSEVKITDLVSQETIDKIKELDRELQSVLASYTATAKELAKGLDITVKGLADIDKLEEALTNAARDATAANAQLNEIMERKRKIIAETTPVISRQLMEQERVNKATREAYTEHERIQKLLEHFHDTYEGQVQSLIKVNAQLKANSKAQKDNEKLLEQGRLTMTQYTARQADLVAQHRALSQEKRTLNQLMTAEEKAAQEADTSYAKMSQQLEMLKKAYKGLSAEGRDSDYGKDLENTIQNLDAHLKDVAADMGEFQRNVGNYAIAGYNGVVSTESLMEALNQQALTIKDVADQNKILLEARSMLDTTDANYTSTVETINEKLAENQRRLADVSDIMGTQATSVAEAEAQNARLSEALKQIDLTSGDAAERTAELNAKIADNNKIIEENTAKKASLKKDLKEMVLEIATLSIQYQDLSTEEQNTAEGQALKEHIDELIERAGVLKDAISDTNAAITNAASDTRGFDQAAGAIQLAIDGFGLATGAAEMLGISIEDLAEIQTKLQAAIAASNAMQSIQNSLQAQSAVMQGVNLVQTKLRTVAENLHTASQGKGVIATTALTAAQWAFNAAATANPIGLIVVAIVACIAAVWGLVKAFTAFLGPSEEATKALEKGIKAVEAMEKAHEGLISVLEKSGATQAAVTKKKLEYLEDELNSMNKLLDEALKNEAEEEKITELREKLWAKQEDSLKAYEDAYFGLTRLVREQNALDIKDREGEAAYKKKLVDMEIQDQKDLLEELKKIALARGYNIQQYDEILEALEKKRQRAYDEINKSAVKKAQSSSDQVRSAINAGQTALLSLIKNSNERQLNAENLKYSQQLQNLNTQLKRINQIEDLSAAQRAQMRESFLNQIQGLEAEHAKNVELLTISGRERALKFENELLELRLSSIKKGSEEELALKVEQNAQLEKMELLGIEERVAKGEITVEEGEKLKQLIAQKYIRLRQEIEENSADDQLKLIQSKYADEASTRDAALTLALASEERAYLERLNSAKGNAEETERIKEDHENNMLNIQEDYARKSAQAAIKMIEEQLAVENLSAEERASLEAALSKAKADYEKLMADQAKAQMDKTVENDKKATKERIANVQKWLKVAADGLNAVNNLAQAIFDGKIQKIEEEQEAGTAAAEEEQNRISELAEKKVITEEEAEARKRAAKVKSEQKNAELEAKKQKLKERQAIWDKANAIAQCGIATALAISQALPNVVLAAIAGAMGALQLATIIATPLPKYAKGTDYHKGGLAVVGDGGRQEVVLINNRAWLTPDTPTLVDLPVGASVIPSIQQFDDNFPGLISVSENYRMQSQKPIVINDYSHFEKEMRQSLGELAYLIKQQTKMQRDMAYEREFENYKNSRI